jgi:hypothetical protein
VILSTFGLIAIIVYPDWETIPLHLIWISATLIYGFRTWPILPTLFVLGMVLACTGTVMGLDVVRGREPLAELTEVPMMDCERLGLAIDALLENAVRHTVKDDVIKLSVATDRAGAVDSGGAGTSGAEVRMTVTDSGSGIHAELLPGVFDRFRVGDSGHPRGTGLGLALVRAVARAHGGDVLVRSWPGHGSDFELLSRAFPPRSADADAIARADDRDNKLARKQLFPGGVVPALPGLGRARDGGLVVLEGHPERVDVQLHGLDSACAGAGPPWSGVIRTFCPTRPPWRCRFGNTLGTRPRRSQSCWSRR